MGLFRSRASLRPRAATQTEAPRRRRRNFGARKTPVSASGPVFPISIDDIGLEHNPDLQGTRWTGSPSEIGIALEMMRDTHMRAAYALGTNPLRTGKWVVKPGGDDGESRKCADALNWNLFKVLNWDSFLEKLLYAHRDGFSLHEVLADFRRFPTEFAPRGGVGLAYTGFEHIPAWTVSEFVPSEENNRRLRGIKQWAGLKNGFLEEKPIEIDWILRYTLDQEGSNFRGDPTNRACYGPWWLKQGYQTFNSIKQERFGVGIPVAKQPQQGAVNPDDIDSVNHSLSELRVNERAFINLPPHWDVGLLSFDNGREATDLLQSIEFCNRDIFLRWGAGFASMGDTKFGSFALGKVHDKHHYLSNRANANSIQAAISSGCDGWGLASRFRDANFPNAEIPRIEVGNLQSRDWLSDLAELDKAVKNGSVPAYDALSTHIVEVLEAPVPDVPFEEMLAAQRAAPTQEPQ